MTVDGSYDYNMSTPYDSFNYNFTGTGDYYYNQSSPYDDFNYNMSHPAGTDFAVGGNLTLGQKITFAFGEIIDNIINGWIQITGSLRITDYLIVEDSMIGNGTANFTLQELNATDGIYDYNMTVDGSYDYNMSSPYDDYNYNQSSPYDDYNYNMTDGDTQLSEDDVEAFILDSDNTANLDMNGFNITANNIFLEDAGGDCDISTSGSICMNATGVYIVG